MTSRLILAALRRRWYVALGVLLVAAMISSVLHARQVYWTRAEIVFLPPAGLQTQGNALEGTDESLIFFAASVERSMNGGPHLVAMSSDSATLYGAGVYKGYSLELVNDGGQWQTNFNRPVLSVQAVAPTARGVQETLDRVVAQVKTLARERQRQLSVPARSEIRTELYPEQPHITLVAGSTKRALAGELLLALGLAVAAALMVDNRLGRRTGRGRSSGEASTRLVSSRSQRWPAPEGRRRPATARDA